MVLFACLVSTSFTLTPLALEHVTALTLNALRFAMAAGLLLIFTVPMAGPRLPRAGYRFVVTGATLAFYFTTMAIALQYAAPLATSAIFALVPLLTIFSSRLVLAGHPPRVQSFGLVVALLGAAIIVFKGDAANLLTLRLGPGELVYLAGCICYAFYAPLIRRFDRGDSPISQSTWTVTAAAMLLGVAASGDLVATDWLDIPASTWLIIAVLAAGPTAACFFLGQFASRHLPPTSVGAYAYATPAFVVLQELMLGGHWPAAWAWIGVATILLGLVALFVRRY